MTKPVADTPVARQGLRLGWLCWAKHGHSDSTMELATKVSWFGLMRAPVQGSNPRPAIYAEYGVTHCWYVDPLAKTLEVFELTGAKWLLAATFKAADPVTAPPFEAHTFALDVLWVEA
jgi:hypothetical protein